MVVIVGGLDHFKIKQNQFSALVSFMFGAELKNNTRKNEISRKEESLAFACWIIQNKDYLIPELGLDIKQEWSSEEVALQ